MKATNIKLVTIWLQINNRSKHVNNSVSMPCSISITLVWPKLTMQKCLYEKTNLKSRCYGCGKNRAMQKMCSD